MKEMLYEVRCLKSNEDMILTLAGQLLKIVQQVRGSYLHLRLKCIAGRDCVCGMYVLI